MKNALQYIILSFIVISTFCSHAQEKTLIEKLGGVNTHFTVFMEDVSVDVQMQYIILKEYSEKYSGSKDDGGGYGLGMQTYKLEFLCQFPSEFKVQIFKSYEIKLWDKNNNLLCDQFWNPNRVSILNLDNGQAFFTLNLINMPIGLWENVAIISINRSKSVPNY